MPDFTVYLDTGVWFILKWSSWDYSIAGSSSSVELLNMELYVVQKSEWVSLRFFQFFWFYLNACVIGIQNTWFIWCINSCAKAKPAKTQRTHEIRWILLIKFLALCYKVHTFECPSFYRIFIPVVCNPYSAILFAHRSVLAESIMIYIGIWVLATSYFVFEIIVYHKVRRSKKNAK